MCVISVFMLSFASFAEEPTQNIDEVQWEYEVHSKDGTLLEKGVIPNAKARMTWKGVTINGNLSYATFKPSGASGLYCIAGNKISVSYQLNKSASHHWSLNEVNLGEVAGETLQASAVKQSYTPSEAGYFYGIIANYSSDPITVNTFSITFK